MQSEDKNKKKISKKQFEKAFIVVFSPVYGKKKNNKKVKIKSE
jgi:hypothetical protein